MIGGLRIAASSSSAFDRLGTPGRRRASVDRRSCAVGADRGRRGSGEPPSRSRRVLAGRLSRQPTSGRGWPAYVGHVESPWSSELGQRGCTSISAGDGQPELARMTADRAGLPASATTARRTTSWTAAGSPVSTAASTSEIRSPGFGAGPSATGAGANAAPLDAAGDAPPAAVAGELAAGAAVGVSSVRRARIRRSSRSDSPADRRSSATSAWGWRRRARDSASSSASRAVSHASGIRPAASCVSARRSRTPAARPELGRDERIGAPNQRPHPWCAGEGGRMREGSRPASRRRRGRCWCERPVGASAALRRRRRLPGRPDCGVCPSGGLL